MVARAGLRPAEREVQPAVDDDPADVRHDACKRWP
jgi:hypothetical protein